MNKVSTKSCQTGTGVIEALVGLAFLALVLSGSVYGLTRGSRIQYANNMRSKIVDTLRGQLMSQGVDLCGKTLTIALGEKYSSNANIVCKPFTSVSANFQGLTDTVSFSVPATQAQIITATLSSDVIGGELRISSEQPENAN